MTTKTEKKATKKTNGGKSTESKAWTEDTVWNPPTQKEPSESSKMLKEMKVGEILRINHPDLACKVEKDGNASKVICSLQTQMYALRKKGKVYQMYHEGPHVAVVRRLEDKVAKES